MQHVAPSFWTRWRHPAARYTLFSSMAAIVLLAWTPFDSMLWQVAPAAAWIVHGALATVVLVAGAWTAWSWGHGMPARPDLNDPHPREFMWGWMFPAFLPPMIGGLLLAWLQAWYDQTGLLVRVLLTLAFTAPPVFLASRIKWLSLQRPPDVRAAAMRLPGPASTNPGAMISIGIGAMFMTLGLAYAMMMLGGDSFGAGIAIVLVGGPLAIAGSLLLWGGGLRILTAELNRAYGDGGQSGR